jgi:predicted membrane protein
VKTSNKGGNVIHDPAAPLTIDQRVFEMWAVHPSDLDALGFQTRQAFFKAHFESHLKHMEKD